MQPSIHYYVLSLNEDLTKLYEGFQETLIEIQSEGFPVASSMHTGGNGTALEDLRLKGLFRKVNRHFSHFFKRDPLRLVVVGSERNQFIFESVTAFQDSFIGKVVGEHAAASAADLGRVVWPIVKQAMGDAAEKARRDLEAAVGMRKAASRLDAV